MSIILSGLIHIFRPLLSSLSGALDCEGLGPWYFLLGLRIVAIFFSNGPWDKAKEDVTCNWIQPMQEKSLAFCTALCHNQHFAISISATWGLVFLLNLLYVGLMRLSSPEEKKEEEKGKEDKDKDKDKDKERGLAVVATAPHSGVADISTVYTVGRHGLAGNNGYNGEDDNDDYNDYDDYPYPYYHPYYPYHPPWPRWHGSHMGPMDEGYGPIVPFGPYGNGGYGRGEYGMPGAGGYGMPGGGGYGMPGEGGHSVPSDGGCSVPSEGGYSVPSEGGHAVPADGGHIMPDAEGRSVPADEACGGSATGGYSVPAGGGYSMPIHPGHAGKTKTPLRRAGPVDCRQTKLATNQHTTLPLQGRVKQTKAASRGEETPPYRVPTRCVPLSSPYRNKYKMATKCRPVIEGNMDCKENMALKRRQVHRNNVPNQSQVGFRNQAPVQQQDSNLAAQSRPTGGPGISTGPPCCCHNAAGCPCAENTCHSGTLCQPSSGNSGPGSQEKAKNAITNLCGVPFFDIWVGFLLATEIAFLCVIIVLQMPSLLNRSWFCTPAAGSCPPSVECVVRGRAEKRVALWGLVLTCCLFIVACSGYFYLRTCWRKRCCQCCGGGNQVEANPESGRATRGDVEGGGRPSGGGQ